MRLDRLVSVKENGSSVATRGYDAKGEVVASSRGAVSTSYGYDPISRLASLSDDLAGTGADVTTTIAAYNPASQLLGRSRDNDRYAYGGYRPTSTGYTANGLNQYAAVAGTPQGYDWNGNLMADGATSYSYDAENRLIALAGAHSGALAYDPLGRLASITGAAGTTRLVYDGDALVLEYDGARMVERAEDWLW